MLNIDENGCKKLISFMFQIKKSPLLFLKEKSLKQIAWIQQGFIWGYNNACDYDLIEFYNKTKDGNPWADFQFYFSDKYKTSSMEHIEVIKYCGSEEKAFDLFYEELELFLVEHNVEIPEIEVAVGYTIDDVHYSKEVERMFAIDKQGCDKLIRFAYEVKKRPPLFLQEKSLKQLALLLQGFIYGYNNACDYDLDEFYEATKDGNIWLDFQDFFCKKYSSESIYHLEVIELCGSEEKAFDLFYEELDRYLREHNIQVPEIR